MKIKYLQYIMLSVFLMTSASAMERRQEGINNLEVEKRSATVSFAADEGLATTAREITAIEEGQELSNNIQTTVAIPTLTIPPIQIPAAHKIWKKTGPLLSIMETLPLIDIFKFTHFSKELSEKVEEKGVSEGILKIVKEQKPITICWKDFDTLRDSCKPNHTTELELFKSKINKGGMLNIRMYPFEIKRIIAEEDLSKPFSHMLRDHFSFMELSGSFTKLTITCLYEYPTPENRKKLCYFFKSFCPKMEEFILYIAKN